MVNAKQSRSHFGKCLIPHLNFNAINVLTWQKLLLPFYIVNVWTQRNVFCMRCETNWTYTVRAFLLFVWNQKKSINNYCAICVDVVCERPLAFSIRNHSRVTISYTNKEQTNTAIYTVVCCRFLSFFSHFLLIYLVHSFIFPKNIQQLLNVKLKCFW